MNEEEDAGANLASMPIGRKPCSEYNSSLTKSVLTDMSPESQAAETITHSKKSQNKPSWLHHIRDRLQCGLCDQMCGPKSELEAGMNDQGHLRGPIIELDEPSSLSSAQVSTEGSTLSNSSSPGRSPVPTLSVSPSIIQYQEMKETRSASCGLRAEEISKSNPVVVTQEAAERQLYLSHQKNKARVHEPEIQSHTNRAQHPVRNVQCEPLSGCTGLKGVHGEDDTNPQIQP
jgi:hypothetical protein